MLIRILETFASDKLDLESAYSMFPPPRRRFGDQNAPPAGFIVPIPSAARPSLRVQLSAKRPSQNVAPQRRMRPAGYACAGDCCGAPADARAPVHFLAGAFYEIRLFFHVSMQ